MKQNLLLLIFLSIVFSAASQADSIGSVKTKAPSIAIINTMDGKKIKGWLYKIDTGNVYLLPASVRTLQPLNYKSPNLNDASYRVEALQINTIALKKKNAGLKGALIGLAAGAAIGAAIGFASGDDPVAQYSGNALGDMFVSLGNAFAMTAGEKAAGLALVGGLTGALIGGITGALLKKKFIIGGKKDVYRNTQEELVKRAMVKF
jgi:hypothetical protein